MTPEMIAKARANADRLSAANVAFRLGEIEHLPLPDEFKTPELWSACMAGAPPEAEYLTLVAGAGFTSIELLSKRGRDAAGLFSVTVRAVKPHRE